MQYESGSDNDREEDIECNGDRVVRDAEVGSQRALNTIRLRGLVEEYDAHRWIGDVSGDLCRRLKGSRTQGLTPGGKIHQGGERDHPVVHAINDVTTIQLEEQPYLTPG